MPLLSLSNIANAQGGIDYSGERERECAYVFYVRVRVCMYVCVCAGQRTGRGPRKGLVDFDEYPVPIYTHRWRKGTRESVVVLVNREERESERKRSHIDGIDSN